MVAKEATTTRRNAAKERSNGGQRSDKNERSNGGKEAAQKERP
jgi:hypothetical protein